MSWEEEKEEEKEEEEKEEEEGEEEVYFSRRNPQTCYTVSVPY